MYSVAPYLRVRLAFHVDGLSQREAAHRFVADFAGGVQAFFQSVEHIKPGGVYSSLELGSNLDRSGILRGSENIENFATLPAAP
ncbi:hypothetical protein N9F34_04575 [Alphaproteobacteria bacterium]|nr:hypothetical protein [Alphaproteobacteria bacterium]